MALPRKNRITSKKEIDYVFKNGRKIRGYFLFLRFVGNQIGYPRFVFIIPSKFISLAVDRNRIRRLFSEEIKKMSYISKNGCDYIVLVSKKTERTEFGHLAEELHKLLSKK